ncbi:MAG: hypothetical protein ACNI27_03705 [Desulfovibrio sp.]
MSAVSDRELLIRIDERTRNTEDKLEGLADTVMAMQREERFCSLHKQRIASLEEDLKTRSAREWGLFAGIILIICRLVYDALR